MSKRKILLVAGGTGGHLFPAQRLRTLLEETGRYEVLFAGAGLKRSPFFQGASFEIEAAPPSRPLSFLWRGMRGLFQSLKLLFAVRPHLVVGFGSYHTFPTLLAARLFGAKIALFEANCVLGRVNRLFAKGAVSVGGQFPLSVKRLFRTPLLPWKREERSVEKKEAREKLGLKPDVTTLLIFGGSQGATFLNERMPKVARALKERGIPFQVLHLTGKGNTALYEGIEGVVKEFEGEMPLAYASADIAICRAGAGTVAELIRFFVPSLLIPFPLAMEDHQRHNGLYLHQIVKGARLVLQSEASVERLVGELEKLLDEREERTRALRASYEESLERKGVIEWIEQSLEG